MTPTVPMIALVKQTYNSRALKANDTFDASSESEAADLVAVRMAARVKQPARLFAAPTVPAAAPVVLTRAIEADPAPSTPSVDPLDDAPGDDNVASIEVDSKNGNYNRRDMRAKNHRGNR